MSQNLKEDFRNALDLETSADCDEIDTRPCSTDKFSGVEYTFYGEYIPIRPIIDVVSTTDDVGIEQIGMVGQGDTRLVVFVANIPNQTHPGFVN